MFCSECGARAAGKFCRNCGTRLTTLPVPDGGREEPLEVIFEDPAPLPPPDEAASWRTDVRYERLLALPAIRERIAAAGRRHQPGVSGEQFLAVFDALVPTGVALEKLCVALQPLYGRLGIKTGKASDARFAAPIGEVIVAALCALAAHGHTLKHVEQSTDGCAVHAVIPSSLWSLAGEMVVSIHHGPLDTVVSANTTIAGQMFDWGHSGRLLQRLFDAIRQELTAPPPAAARAA